MRPGIIAAYHPFRSFLRLAESLSQRLEMRSPRSFDLRRSRVAAYREIVDSERLSRWLPFGHDRRREEAHAHRAEEPAPADHRRPDHSTGVVASVEMGETRAQHPEAVALAPRAAGV